MTGSPGDGRPQHSTATTRLPSRWSHDAGQAWAGRQEPKKPVPCPTGSPPWGGRGRSQLPLSSMKMFFAFTAAEGRSCPAWSQRRGGRRGDRQGDIGRGLKAPMGEQQGEAGRLNKARGGRKEACHLTRCGTGDQEAPWADLGARRQRQTPGAPGAPGCLPSSTGQLTAAPGSPWKRLIHSRPVTCRHLICHRTAFGESPV